MKRILFFIGLFLIFQTPVLAQNGFLEKIVIDPGHGGYDAGISDGVKEKDVALSVARRVGEILREEHRKVFLTRKVDQYLSISERLALANQWEPDLFLSIHLSESDAFAVYVTWYTDTEAELTLRGYYSISSRQRRYLYESKALASFVGETFKREFGLRVFQRDMPLPVLDSIGAPAVLVELPSRGIEYDKETLERMAYAIAIGVEFYGRR
jgi:N-acetylmuramoyl-L-alanine amidase